MALLMKSQMARVGFFEDSAADVVIENFGCFLTARMLSPERLRVVQVQSCTFISIYLYACQNTVWKVMRH
jgi:hypothetical protein